MSANKSKRELIRSRRKAQKRQQRMTLILISSAAVLLVVLAVLLPKVLVSRTKYKNTDGFSVGDPNAPIVVEEFTDYLCSHCKNFALNYEEDFIKAYAETGKVYFTFNNFPFMTEDSYRGAEASYCAAEQNRLYEFKDFLFTYAGYQDAFSDSALISYATSAGLDPDQFETCLLSDKYLNTYVEDLTYGQSVGVQGTPTFVVNGTVVSSAELIPYVDSLLEQMGE